MVEADGRKEFKTEDTFDEISAAQQMEFKSWFVIGLNICRRS